MVELVLDLFGDGQEFSVYPFANGFQTLGRLLVQAVKFGFEGCGRQGKGAGEFLPGLTQSFGLFLATGLHLLLYCHPDARKPIRQAVSDLLLHVPFGPFQPRSHVGGSA